MPEPDPRAIRVTIGPNPWDTRVECDGRLVQNVIGLKLEQPSASDTARLELTIFGPELVMETEMPLAEVLIKGLCPTCKVAFPRPQTEDRERKPPDVQP